MFQTKSTDPYWQNYKFIINFKNVYWKPYYSCKCLLTLKQYFTEQKRSISLIQINLEEEKDGNGVGDLFLFKNPN